MEPTTGMGIAEVALEVALSIAIQNILARDDLTDNQKAQQISEEIRKTFKTANASGKRLFFGPSHCMFRFDQLVNSIAVEDLHEAYYTVCRQQFVLETTQDGGVLLVVYGARGMGKSRAAISLLAMKHSRAPRYGYFFLGKPTFTSGDVYYDYLIDNCLARGAGSAVTLSNYDAFRPDAVANLILNSIPQVSVKDSASDPQTRGVLDIPGVRAYFTSTERSPGGAPVVVFDDVNISVDDEGWTDDETLKNDLDKKLGKAAVFFGSLMSLAHSQGVVVIVLTSNVYFAKYLHLLNNKTKARMFKPVADPVDFTCQFSDWKVENRVRFLKLAFERLEAQVSDGDIDAEAKESIRGNNSIREMVLNLTEYATIPRVTTSVSAQGESSSGYLCGCNIS